MNWEFTNGESCGKIMFTIAGEQGVPAEEHVPHLQGDGALGVAGGVEHLNGHIPQGKGVPLVIEFQVGDLPGQGEQAAARPVGVGLVDINFRLGQGLVQLWHGGGVVIVAVGQQDVFHVHAVVLYHLENAPGLVAGVDDGGHVGLLVLQQIAVGPDGTHLKHLHLHGIPSLLQVK